VQLNGPPRCRPAPPARAPSPFSSNDLSPADARKLGHCYHGEIQDTSDSMHSLIAQKRDDISRICQRHHVKKLEVFGSAARAVDFDPMTSDADFLVEFEAQGKQGLENYFSVKAELEALLLRQVDLVEPASVRNPYLRAAIDQAREVIYAA
jgi:uncharacterized protein